MALDLNNSVCDTEFSAILITRHSVAGELGSEGHF